MSAGNIMDPRQGAGAPSSFDGFGVAQVGDGKTIGGAAASAAAEDFEVELDDERTDESSDDGTSEEEMEVRARQQCIHAIMDAHAHPARHANVRRPRASGAQAQEAV